MKTKEEIEDNLNYIRKKFDIAMEHPDSGWDTDELQCAIHTLEWVLRDKGMERYSPRRYK